MSLNGLSFCVLDTIAQKVVKSEAITFKTASTPYLLLKALKELFTRENLLHTPYEEVSVIHRNDLYCLVPKPLFDKEELPNYLKFNTKLLANDEIVFDELPNNDLVCVYVPFTNINNYLFECFGEFEFIHNSLVVIQTLLQQKSNKTFCYAHVSPKFLDIIVMEQRELVLYNQFEYKTKEDFLYYVLFTYEQLGLDVETVKLKLFGTVEEGDELYTICYKYLKKVAVFIPKFGDYHLGGKDKATIDLTLLGN